MSELPMQAALKFCNQALAKYPGQPLFTILKAYAYDRAGDSSTVMPLIQIVIDCKHADDESLHHAATLLKNRGDFEKLLELYTKAAARAPPDINLQQQLFLTHARLGNALMQQQTAIRLCKLDSNELHAFWLVESMLTQADNKRSGTSNCPQSGVCTQLSKGCRNYRVRLAPSYRQLYYILLQQQLSLTHARLGNALLQQQIAMRPSKLDENELHAFWLVEIMLTQADNKRLCTPSRPPVGACTQPSKSAGIAEHICH
jgi:tetratricopeptide (TPR) repeat protein